MKTDSETFIRRRRQLAGLLGSNAIAVIPGARVQRRNGDNEHPFRQDSDLLYLCGFDEPDATLVVSSDGTSSLFCRDRDPLVEMWRGAIAGPQRARGQTAVDEAHALAAIAGKMPALLANRSVVWLPGAAPAGRDGFHGEVSGWLQAMEVSAPASQLPALEDLRPLVAQMRLIKDEQELAVMREAARISCRAHVAAMRRCALMLNEGRTVHGFDLEAEVLYVFRAKCSALLRCDWPAPLDRPRAVRR